MTAATAGIEADEAVPTGVVAGLAADGIDVSGLRPRQLTGAMIASARRIVALGCHIDDAGYALADLRQWDDIPAVSDGFEPARDIILARVSALVDELA
jgi:protein-tyrosine-phosphatase